MPAITGTAFWDEFLTILEGGKRTSVIDYYLPNKAGDRTDFAKEGEWANVIEKTFERTSPNSPERIRLVELLSDAGFWAPTDDLQFWIDQPLNTLDIGDLTAAAEQRFPQMFDANDASVGVGSMDPNQLAQITNPNDPRLGAGGPPQGSMRGMTLTKIATKDGREIWGLTGVVGGIQHVYTFDSFDAMKKALGEDAVTSGRYGFLQLPESSVNDGNTWILGDAAGFVGQPGEYSGWFNNTMNEAALEAGIRNPGMVGRYLADPEIQRIIAMGGAGDWSDARVQAEIRNTTFYNDTLYPGIKNYLNVLPPGVNPEARYMQYMQDVSSSLESLGYERGDDGTYRNMMDEMLSAGLEADEINAFAPVFVRAEESQNFAQALSFWTKDELGRDLSFEDWVDVLAGTSTAEMNGIVERAQLQFQAEQQLSTNLSPEQISRLSEMTGLSEQQMASAFNQAEEALLSLGDAGLNRYNLSEAALVNAAFNLKTPGAPISVTQPGQGPAGPPLATEGITPELSAEQVRRTAKKTILELGLQDDPKAQFFVGFNQRGAPIRQGLSAGAPELG